MTNDDLKRFYGTNAVPEKKKDFVRYNDDGTISGTYTVWSNIEVTEWIEDDTYPDYPYKAEISLEGVTEQDPCMVVFDSQDSTSGNYSSVCQSINGAVVIYGMVNTTITIPSIIKF